MSTHSYYREIGPAKKGTGGPNDFTDQRMVPFVSYCVDRLITKIDFTGDFAEMIIYTLNNKSLMVLAEEIATHPELLYCDEVPSSDLKAELTRTVKNVFDTDMTIPSHTGTTRKILADTFYNQYSGKRIKDPLTGRTLELSRQLLLENDEAAFLALLYAANSLNFLGNILSDDSLNKFLALSAIILDTDISRMNRRVDPEFFPPPYFSLSGNINLFLGRDHGPFAFDSYAADFTDMKEPPVLPPEAFTVDSNKLEMVKKILRDTIPSHILLYGTPGTGKSELARTLVKESGKGALFLKNETREGDGTLISRQLALELTGGRCTEQNKILVVDEADRILNTEDIFHGEVEKGWLVEFFDQAGTQIIWVTNSRENLHPAVARRFTYSIGFRSFSEKQRQKVWENLIERSVFSSVISDKTIARLSRDFTVDAGGISMALRITGSLLENRNSPVEEEETISILSNVLCQHETLLMGKKSGGLKRITDSYDPDILNTDIDPDELQRTISAYINGNRNIPLNLLFWGAPGTGKSELVKYLAEQNNIKLITRRASDLLNKYVGNQRK